jgi:4,5-dihydroxyphthalate decarboxylase
MGIVNATGTTTLRTVLESYPYTSGVIDGTYASPKLQFEFIETKPIIKAFAPMANQQAYDLAEMAIVTFIQALAEGKGVSLLPIMLLSRFHHASIVKAAKGPIHAPGDLNGKKIGVRSYTQTTGVWVRGILYGEYGVDLDSVTNVTTEGGHIKEYVEPPSVVRVPPETAFEQALVNGEIDAWISGPRPPDADIVPLVDDANAVANAWFDRVGAFPINHMLTIRTALLDEQPWIAREIFDVLTANKAAYLDDLRGREPVNADEVFRKKLLARGQDPLPFGVEALRPSLDLVIDSALAQKLIPRRYTAEDLFDPRVRDLI